MDERRPPRPIASYGIILFAWEGNEPLFLIYQRRDSYEYIDFLRGIWSSEQLLPDLFARMSEDERRRLAGFSFDELWDDLWVSHECSCYQDGYDKAWRKYHSVADRLPEYLALPHENCEPPWGFPKGKKNRRSETDLECALRECGEETKLSPSEFQVWPASPFTETYKGNNHKYYSTAYFLAEVPHPIPLKKIPTPQCIRTECLSEEAHTAEWLTLAQARTKLDPRRALLLERVHEHIVLTARKHQP